MDKVYCKRQAVQPRRKNADILVTECDGTAEGVSERLADFSIFNMADFNTPIVEDFLEKDSTKICEAYSKSTVDYNS